MRRSTRATPAARWPTGAAACIGINDSIAGQSGGNVGVGFAVPIDIARSVADRIVAGKSLAAGFLGVEALDAKGARSGAQLSSVDVRLACGQGRSPTRRRRRRHRRREGRQHDRPRWPGSAAGSPASEISITFVRGGQEQTVTSPSARRLS